MNVGVGVWIERRARLAPSDVAIVAEDRATTYAELATRVRRLANGLRGLGVERGDRVAWLGPNHPAFLETFFAAGLLGAATAPVNHRLPSDGVLEVLADAEPGVLVSHDTPVPSGLPPSIRHCLVVDRPGLGHPGFEALIAASPADPLDVPVALDDVCLLAHTSGTTGAPKGVMLTHGNVTWNVVNLLSCVDVRGGDVTVAVAPFFRVGGTGVNVLPVLFGGGTVVVPSGIGGDEVLRLTERHRVTVGFGNPDSLEAMVRAPAWPSADLSSLRFVITGGAPVPERLIRTFLERGVTLLQGYGLSEAAPVVLVLDAANALRKVGSAGRPPLFVETAMVDAEGAALPAGRTGELLVRGPNVMKGYWRRPEETAAVLGPDGWLRTGDAARSDDEGFITIMGRVDDRLSVSGWTVHPGDVERVLLSHPDVLEAAITRIPVDDGADAIAALVVPVAGRRPTEQDLLALARRRLPPHEVPARVTFVDALPRSSVGKLLRARLAELVEGPPTARAEPPAPGIEHPGPSTDPPPGS